MKASKALSTSLALAAAFASSVALAKDPGSYAKANGVPAPTIAVGHAEGKMDNSPYSSSYLPRSQGPLSKEHDTEVQDMIEKGFGDCDLVHQIVKDNAKKAATEKFDSAVKTAEGRDPGLTASYNRDGYNPNAEGWEGFCHLWSPAGLDPASAFIIGMDRIYANVPFGIGDLRELTTYNYPSPYTKFVGTRNNGQKTDDQNLDPIDLLATFQAYIGSGKPGVVIDREPGTQVWNQPMQSFSTDTTELAGDDAKGGGRKAKHAYLINMTGTYAVESGFANRGEPNLSSESWKMKVWTDKDGKVVKSEFVKDGSDPIPDFAWVPIGKNTSPNFERLQKIAREGVAVKDIENFCKGMQALTKDSLATDGAKLAALLNNVCPVLDQNKLDAYVKATAARTGIDYSALDAALNGGAISDAPSAVSSNP